MNVEGENHLSMYINVSRICAHACFRDFLIKSNFEKSNQISADLWCCLSFKKNDQNRGRKMALYGVLVARSQTVTANLNLFNELYQFYCLFPQEHYTPIIEKHDVLSEVIH